MSIIIYILSGTLVTVHAEPLKVVKIQVYPQAAVLIPLIAKEEGFCTKAGIECELVTIPSTVVGIQTLLANGIDVGATILESFIQAASQKTPILGIGGGLSLYPYMLVVPHGSMPAANNMKDVLNAVRDLKGKRVGVTTLGSGPYYVLDAYLQQAGLSMTDITPVAVGGPATAYTALMHKQVDALMSYTPMGSICDVLKTCTTVFRVMSFPPKVLHVPNNALVEFTVRRDYPEKAIKAVREAFAEASNYIQDPTNKEKVKAIYMKSVKFNLPNGNEIALKSFERNYKYQHWTKDTLSDLENGMKYMVVTKQLRQKVDLQPFVLR